MMYAAFVMLFFPQITTALCGVAIINHIDKAAAEKAAQIRAKYPSFKTADALQLAAACCSNCDMFLTNDKQLKQCKEIKCVTVDELKNGI